MKEIKRKRDKFSRIALRWHVGIGIKTNKLSYKLKQSRGNMEGNNISASVLCNSATYKLL